jgi:Holliday junction resolvase RusA-like endonuclease
MIGQVKLGNYAKRIIEYCYYDKHLTAQQRRELGPDDVRGELVYIQHLALQKLPDGRFDIDNLIKQFLDNRDRNTKLNKFVWHQSFSFPPGENPGDDKIREITAEFARDFGFEQNQMIVFRHADTAHAHFHVVANRINYNGKNTADHFNNYARTGKFCRRIELELGLSITPEMHLTDENRQESRQTNKAILNLKELIDQQMPTVKTFDELKSKLEKHGYKTYLGRGIAFMNTKNGMKLKGSQIGREYSLANLEKRLGQTLEMVPAQTVKRRQRKQSIRLH